MPEATDSGTDAAVAAGRQDAGATNECKRLLEALKQEETDRERQMCGLKQQEIREWEGHLANLSVPSKPAMERIVRLHRELHRTVRQLTSLQQQRKGQCPPLGGPP